MPNTFVDQRLRLEMSDRLAGVMETLPQELRGTNAAPLLNIVRELEASSIIELGVISAVTQVDAEDRQAIRLQRDILADYHDRRLYDRDRTHCSNIRRTLTQVGKAAEGSGDASQLRVVNDVLRPILGADEVLLDDIETILAEAVNAITAMDAADRLTDVEAAQREFAAKMEPLRSDIKANLARMSALTNQLIDEL